MQTKLCWMNYNTNTGMREGMSRVFTSIVTPAITMQAGKLRLITINIKTRNGSNFFNVL
jgi:N-methylhydantoinase B/oxoprolinase/acetone carboxylase alpha subunit